MALPKYRVVDGKGAYMARSPEVVLLELGADGAAARTYNIRGPIFELLTEGTEVDFDGVPGPHLEPLNPEAHERMRQYLESYPGASLDPTRSLGVTGGSSVSLTGTIMEQLNALLNGALAGAPMLAAPVQDDSELISLRADVVSMKQQISELLARLAAEPVRAARVPR